MFIMLAKACWPWVEPDSPSLPPTPFTPLGKNLLFAYVYVRRESMSDKFKQLFEEARGSGVDPEWVDRFESTFEASGLRKDNQAIKDENRLLRETATKLKSGLLKDRFEKIGITISPSILNIPDELDPSDPEKVQSWAEEMGLITKQETTSQESRVVHDKIAAASNEGNVTSIPSNADIQNLGEDEFWKVAEAREAAIKAGKATPV